MGETISGRVLDALLSAGLITAEQLASASKSAEAAGTDVGSALVERGLVSAGDLSTVLEEELGIPRVDLSSYAPDDEALQIIPAAVARGRNMLPLFEIEGMLTVAIAEAADVFQLDRLAEEFSLEIEAVLADASSVAEAIDQYYGADGLQEPLAEGVPAPPVADAQTAPSDGIAGTDFFEAPVVEQAPTVIADAEVADEQNAAVSIEEVVANEAPAGAGAIDLDVLAVADERKVAVLVSDILEHAVARGASRIHLLAYKGDFFLVFRIAGRLEKVASAPLSMQAALVDGFKQLARLGAVPASQPALGRVRAEVSGKDVVLTVSSVPTVAGQRLVVSITTDRPEPRGLLELGMSDAETRALHAMVERGRGLLLVCAPVAGGRSSTYYALCAHAAASGKTVYSVERSIDYEIPAVAQVMVNPGSPIGAESYFAAGMRQDTDVMAIDAMQSVEDVHLAIEAAGMGKLVIATFSGADIVSGVRRMLDLGAEPVSLAAALTLGVGQRVVRTNCPNCSVEEAGALASAIPGAPAGLTSRAGSGCPNCGKTGFAGSTAIFEVLPFTEPVRAKIAAGAPLEMLRDTVGAAGMRPMVASGLARVEQGLVSAAELNRVLRFAE